MRKYLVGLAVALVLVLSSSGTAKAQDEYLRITLVNRSPYMLNLFVLCPECDTDAEDLRLCGAPPGGSCNDNVVDLGDVLLLGVKRPGHSDSYRTKVISSKDGQNIVWTVE
jgi:hypothetical protein